MLNLKQKLNLRKNCYLVCLQRLFVEEILVNLTNIWVCTTCCVQKRLQYIYGWIGQSQPSRFWRGSNLTSSQTLERPKFVSISEKFATRGSQRKYPRFSSNICSWNFSKTKTHGRKMNGHTWYLLREPRVYPCKLFLAGVNFYRFNAKNWHFRQILREKWRFFTDLTRKIGVFRFKFYSPKILPM